MCSLWLAHKRRHSSSVTVFVSLCIFCVCFSLSLRLSSLSLSLSCLVWVVSVAGCSVAVWLNPLLVLLRRKNCRCWYYCADSTSFTLLVSENYFYHIIRKDNLKPLKGRILLNFFTHMFTLMVRNMGDLYCLYEKCISTKQSMRLLHKLWLLEKSLHKG